MKRNWGVPTTRCTGRASDGRPISCSHAAASNASDTCCRRCAGDRVECLAMTEPGAGSDLRSMKTTAVAQGDDFVINGTKHFISHADQSDFVILFAASGEETNSHGVRKKLMTAFLIDMGHPGFEVRTGYKNVSHRGYTNSILEFSDCRVPKSAVLGEAHRGFDVANNVAGRHALAGCSHLPRPRGACAGTRHPMGRQPGAVRTAHRKISRRQFQACGHGRGVESCRTRSVVRCLEERSRHRH